MQSKERIEYVTRHFSELQGLRIVPFAVYLVAGAVYDATWGYPYHVKVGMGLLWLIALGAVLAYVLLGSYYRRRFGHVQPQVDRRTQKLTSGLFILFLLVNFTLVAVDRATDQVYHSWVMVGWWGTLALILFVIWGVMGFPLGRPRRFSLWPVLLLMATGVWDLPGSPSQEACYPNAFNLCVVLDLVLAAVVVLGGYYNHRLLAEVLQPLPQESHG